VDGSQSGGYGCAADHSQHWGGFAVATVLKLKAVVRWDSQPPAAAVGRHLRREVRAILTLFVPWKRDGLIHVNSGYVCRCQGGYV
jgi:hypothetical protein